MVAHRPSAPPLTQIYAATENSVPAALNMMVAWRTATGTKGRFYIIDPVSHQLYMIVTLVEGPTTRCCSAASRPRAGRFRKSRFFENRSRGQGGFQYSGEGLANMPEEWTKPVAANRLLSRAELLHFGQSIFDSRIDGPPVSNDCVLMENGKIWPRIPALRWQSAAAVPRRSARPLSPIGTARCPFRAGTQNPSDRSQGAHRHRRHGTGYCRQHGHCPGRDRALSRHQSYRIRLRAQSDPEGLRRYAQAQQKFRQVPRPALRPMAAMGTTAHILRIYDASFRR